MARTWYRELAGFSQLAVEDEVDSGVWLKEAPKKISAGRARSGP
jgi:hypothetical protein